VFFRGRRAPAPIAPTKFLVTDRAQPVRPQPTYIGVFAVLTWRGSNIPLHATPELRRIPLHPGTTVCRLLRRTHAPPPVRRFVPAISPLRPALDSAALTQHREEEL